MIERAIAYFNFGYIVLLPPVVGANSIISINYNNHPHTLFIIIYYDYYAYYYYSGVMMMELQ